MLLLSIKPSVKHTGVHACCIAEISWCRCDCLPHYPDGYAQFHIFPAPRMLTRKCPQPRNHLTEETLPDMQSLAIHQLWGQRGL